MKTTQNNKTTTALTLTINSKTLADAFITLAKVINPSPIVRIIENVHATLNKGELTLRATDMKTTMVTMLSYTPEIGETEGVFLIPHKLSMELLKSLPNTSITLLHEHSEWRDEKGKLQESFKLTYRVEKQKYVLESECPVNYPKDLVVDSDEITLPADQLQEGLKFGLTSVSNDELRPAMMGVYFDCDTKNLTLASTDAHTIVVYETKVPSIPKFSFILRTDAAHALLGVITPTTQEVTISKSKNAVRISANNYTITSQLIDERFPDYKNAIPTTFPNTVKVDMNEWKALVKRSLLFSSAITNAVKNEFSPSRLRVSSEYVEYNSESDQEIDIDGECDYMAIGVNGKNLLRVTQAISGTVAVSFMAPNRILQLTTENSLAESLRVGVMPVMLLDAVQV